MSNCIFFLFSHAFSAETGLVEEKTLQERIKAAEDSKDIDDAARKSLLELYSKTLDHLDSIKTNKQRSKNYSDARAQVPEEIKVLEKKLESLERQQE